MKKILLDANNCKKYLRGLPWFAQNGGTHRLPSWAKNHLPEDLWDTAQDAAGARICFSASTQNLGLRCLVENFASRVISKQFLTRGFDLYVDGIFWKNLTPDADGIFEGMFFRAAKRETYQFEIYLPLFLGVNQISIVIDSNAEMLPPAPPRVPLPLVLYGTSISQGFNASRPGLSFGAVAARKRELDFVNYGFSGTGRGEATAAEVVAATPACCYVLDFGQNSETIPEFRDCFRPFAEIVRAKNPETPILLTLPILYLYEKWDIEGIEKQAARREIVAHAFKELGTGDANMHLFDWSAHVPLHTGAGQSDGSHPNDIGHMWMGQALADKLAELL